MSTRKCPVSGETMVHEHLHGVELDRSSEGVWLDKGELFELAIAIRKESTSLQVLMTEIKGFFSVKQRHDERGTGEPGTRALPCPCCDQSLQHDLYRDVHIDRCTPCGVWLDQGELDLILTRIREDANFMRGMRPHLFDQEY